MRNYCTINMVIFNSLSILFQQEMHGLKDDLDK